MREVPLYQFMESVEVVLEIYGLGKEEWVESSLELSDADVYAS